MHLNLFDAWCMAAHQGRALACGDPAEGLGLRGYTEYYDYSCKAFERQSSPKPRKSLKKIGRPIICQAGFLSIVATGSMGYLQPSLSFIEVSMVSMASLGLPITRIDQRSA